MNEVKISFLELDGAEYDYEPEEEEKASTGRATKTPRLKFLTIPGSRRGSRRQSMRSDASNEEEVKRRQEMIDSILAKEKEQKDAHLCKQPRKPIRKESWKSLDSEKHNSVLERIASNQEIIDASVRLASQRAAEQQ